jgi:hypothetical protein
VNDPGQMTKAEAEQWVAGLPWRRVREDRGPIDSHEYVISTWDEVDIDLYWAAVRLIKREGYQGVYRAPYRPEVEMRNAYLEIDQHVYWAIPPKQICRTRIEDRQHEPVPEQESLLDDERSDDE